MRREEAYRVVPPIVAAAFLDEVVVVDERMGGKKLHRSNPKAAYVIDDFVVHKTCNGPPISFRNRGVAHGEAAHMGFVEYRSFPRHVRAALISPCKGWIDDPALRHVSRAVPRVEGQITVRRTEGVPEERVVPLQFADDLLGVGVQQELVRIEPVPFLRNVRPVHPVAIDLPRTDIRQITMPNFVRVFRQLDALDLGRSVGIKEA